MGFGRGVGVLVRVVWWTNLCFFPIFGLRVRGQEGSSGAGSLSESGGALSLGLEASVCESAWVLDEGLGCW